MNTCIKCGCEDAYPSLPPCPTPEGCPNPQPCAEFFDAACVRFTLPNIVCGLDTVVFQDDTIAEALDNIVSYFCQRLVTLTNYINAQLLVINNRLTTIEGDIVEIRSDITNIQGDIVDIQGDITDIQGDITTIQGDISTIEGNITTIEGDITTINTQIGEAMPVGSVIPWAGQSSLPIPTGWLPCDGSAVSTTTYAALFAVINDEYGTGAPVGTFYLPYIIDAIPYGSNSANVGTAVGDNTLAGNVSVDISIANLPEHTHSISGLTTDPAGAHDHTIYLKNSAGDGDRAKGTDTDGGDTAMAADGISDAPDHTHGISGSIGSTGTPGTTQATGTITSGDNRQRGISMRYMIKY